MKPGANTHYHARAWPAACAAQGWKRSDETKRREITRACLAAVRAPSTITTTSDLHFGDAETTALFVYLYHLANPADLNLSAEWVKCCEDYRTYNLAKQADWHERELYGSKKNRLDKNRFGGAATAAAGPLDTLNPDAVYKRHLTMASRHQKALREGRKGPIPASQTPATTPAATPAETPNQFAYAEGENPF